MELEGNAVAFVRVILHQKERSFPCGEVPTTAVTSALGYDTVQLKETGWSLVLSWFFRCRKKPVTSTLCYLISLWLGFEDRWVCDTRGEVNLRLWCHKISYFYCCDEIYLLGINCDLLHITSDSKLSCGCQKYNKIQIYFTRDIANYRNEQFLVLHWLTQKSASVILS